jgi:hypothetical protein
MIHGTCEASRSAMKIWMNRVVTGKKGGCFDIYTLMKLNKTSI